MSRKLDCRLGALSESAATLASVDINATRTVLLRIALRGVDDALLDVGGEVVEGLVDVDVGLGRDLEEWDAELLGERLALLRRDDALLFPVALVADEDLVNALGGVLFYVGEPCADLFGRLLASLLPFLLF